MSTLCDHGPCQGCRHASLASVGPGCRMESRPSNWASPVWLPLCAAPGPEAWCTLCARTWGSGNDWKLPWVAGTELESALPVFRLFRHGHGSTGRSLHVCAPLLKLLIVLPNLIGDFEAMPATRLVVFCGKMRDAQEVMSLLDHGGKHFVQVRADDRRWWIQPLLPGVDPDPNWVTWEMVREHADQMMANADGYDDRGSIVVVWSSSAAVAECAATCLFADAAFRPSAFRNKFPHELSALQ